MIALLALLIVLAFGVLALIDFIAGRLVDAIFEAWFVFVLVVVLL